MKSIYPSLLVALEFTAEPDNDPFFLMVSIWRLIDQADKIDSTIYCLDCDPRIDHVHDQDWPAKIFTGA